MAEPYTIGQMVFRAEYEGYLYFRRFRVARVTPAGAWVVADWEWEAELLRHRTASPLEVLAEVPNWKWQKWIPVNARFASLTQAEAVERLYYRTCSYVGHCNRRLIAAEKKLRGVTEARERPHNEDTPTTGEEEPWDGRTGPLLTLSQARYR